MADPDVTLQIEVNGGAPSTGGIVGSVGDTIQMTAADKSGWSGSPVTRWEIVDFPPAFTVPAGWSTDSNGSFYYDGTADPPSWVADEWGDYALRITVLGRYTDERTRFRILSPTLALRDHAYRETTQFGTSHSPGGVDAWKRNWRALETAVGALATADYLATPDTVALRDSDGDIEFRHVYADQLLAQATTNVLLGCDAAGYITFWESVTEIARIFDNGGTRSLTFQGAVAAEVISGGRLDLGAASGSYVLVKEASTEILRISDDTNVSTISGRGSGGTVIASNSGGLTCQAGAGNLLLQCAAASVIQLREDGTAVLEVSDAANVSTIAGQGSGGTRLAAGTGNLVLDAASGGVVRISENGTTVCDIYDAAGTRHVDFGAATIVDNTASFIAVRASSSYVALEGNDVYLNADTIHFRSEAGTLRAQIVNTGTLVLPVIAAASVSSPSAGSYALFFDSSNSDKLSKKSSGGVVTVIGTEA